MITAIHQPSYFPWLGWMDKINKCDQFILMDEVQLSDRAYQHRNLFLTNTGQPFMHVEDGTKVAQAVINNGNHFLVDELRRFWCLMF